MDSMRLEILRQIDSNAFFSSACKHYGMSGLALDMLLKDYDLEPKGAYGPRGDEAVPLSMTEIAKRVGLPVRVVGRLQDLGAIDKPITCNNFEFLKSYKKTWGVVFFLKSQLAKFSQKQREDILTRPELSNKWEQWVYSHYLNNSIDYGRTGRMINPKKRIHIADLAVQIESMFGVPNCQNVRDHIKKIREMAYNDRKAGKSRYQS